MTEYTYTDIKNNTYRVLQTILSDKDERKNAEEEIVAELYKIFAGK